MTRQFQENYSNVNKLVYDSSLGIARRFPVETPATLYQKGQIVALQANGNVEIATNTDFAIGVVTVANIPNDPAGPIHHADTVTVHLVTYDHAYGYVLGAAIAPGDLIVANGQSGVDAEFMSYQAAVTGEYATAIAITGAAVGAQIEVGLLNTPVLIP